MPSLRLPNNTCVAPTSNKSACSIFSGSFTVDGDAPEVVRPVPLKLLSWIKFFRRPQLKWRRREQFRIAGVQDGGRGPSANAIWAWADVLARNKLLDALKTAAIIDS